MGLVKKAVVARVARAAFLWAAANPVKAVQLGIAVAVIGGTLIATRKLDAESLKRAARMVF